jgi:ribosomal-protein-alanine N-acetyltransferase
MTRFAHPNALKKNGLERIGIQKMDAQDLEEVLFIETSTSLTPWSLKMFIEEMQNPLAYCFVMKHEDGSKPSVISFICFQNVIEESELLNIGVHPHYRQLGLGKKLMQFYIDFCHPLGIKTFYLEVNTSNQGAIHLYQCFSYEPLGVRKKFYQGKFDALLMMKKV